MEIFFVYGLVLIFFIALPIVIFVVMKEPAREPTAEELARSSSHKASNKLKVSLTPSNIAAYGLLTAIFALLFVVTMLTQRGRAA